MSQEIRRLHRQQTSFTNFSSTFERHTSSNPDSDSDSPSRRRRRKRDSPPLESTNTDLGPSSSPQIETPSQIPLPIPNNDISAIHAEIQEDLYHQQLSQSDFSDDTHDWGGEHQSVSYDYWHFLGSFE